MFCVRGDVMQWINVNDRLPDSTRHVFASNGKQVVIMHYSSVHGDWFNPHPLLPGYENWIDTDKTPIILWSEIADLIATLTSGEA